MMWRLFVWGVVGAAWIGGVWAISAFVRDVTAGMLTR